LFLTIISGGSGMADHEMTEVKMNNAQEYSEEHLAQWARLSADTAELSRDAIHQFSRIILNSDS
jgi:hypothetical protein